MDNQNNLKQHVADIVDLARLAPSVHNTQPWFVDIKNDLLIIKLDRKHVLNEGDPTGRETIISLGIFAEALSIAASAQGFAAIDIALHDNGDEAQLRLIPAKSNGSQAAQVVALRHRCSDRSIYRNTTVTPQIIDTIVSAWSSSEVAIHVITDTAQIQHIADLTRRAIRVAMSSPNFRRELGQFLTMPWSHKRRGIAVSSLYIPRLAAYFEPLSLRLGLGLNKEARLEERRWLSASGVVAITTAGDMPKYWFEAGRAYLRASLAIESLGLAQATSAATVEASNYHDDVENMLHTTQRLQTTLRIGKGSPHKRFSPRISTATILRQSTTLH